MDVLLEQYKGIVEEQEEEVQSGAPTTAPVRSTKRNRQPVRGIILPQACVFVSEDVLRALMYVSY